MRLFTISNQSRLYGEYISQACVLPRLMNCREIEPVSVLFRGPGIRSEIPGTRDKEECGAGGAGELNTVSHVSGIRGIEKKRQNFKKTTILLGVKWRFRLATAVKCQVRQGLLTRHEKNFRTFDIFTVCNFAVCTRRQKPVGDARKPRTWNMNCLHKT